MEDQYIFAATSPVMGNVGLDGIHEHGTLSTSVRDKEEALERLEEGSIFLDRDSIDHDVFARGVISGPMVDVKQTADVDRCKVPSHMVDYLQGSFRTLAKAQQCSTTPGPLDTLSIPAFCAYWVELGATVYRITDGELVAVSDAPK